MHPQRKTDRRELTPVERAYLVGRHDAGQSFGQISQETGTPKSTVVDTIHNAQKRDQLNSLPRARPRKTDARTDRKLRREVRKTPESRRKLLAEIEANFQPHISRRTIQRRLQETHVQKWLAKGRSILKPEHKKARYQWALKHQDFDWSKVLWSDECLVERNTGKGPVWVFRTPQEKWDQDCIEPREDSKKDIKVMFWGCFGGMAMMGLTDLPGDSESKRGGVTGRIILEFALKKILPQILDGHPEFIFMQDGAGVHKKKELVDWLKEKGYRVMPWPPYSPDLNPIEHVWAELKKLVHKLHPELYSMEGPEDLIIEKIKSAVYEAWEHISDDYLYSLIDSMKERVEAVRKAKGGYTRF
jgi:transposase